MQDKPSTSLSAVALRAAPENAPPLSWMVTPIDPSQGLGSHLQDWDALNRSLFNGHAMLDGLYVDALLRHFGAEGVILCAGRRAGRISAMCLLRRHDAKLGIWSSYLPAQAQLGPSLLPPDCHLDSLFRALPGLGIELDLLCNDPKFGDMRLHADRPLRAVPHALTMSVSLQGSFDDYWAQRPRKLIQNMRRYQRRLQSERGMERLEIIDEPDTIVQAVQRYAALESSGWKGREGTAVSSDGPQGRFYAHVMSRFAAQGEALVYELWQGDDLLASRMLLIRGDMVVMLKTAFHESFERFAPGRILLLRTLEDLFRRRPGAVVEFYTDAESDLLAWSTSQRWINHVSLYRHRGLPAAYSMVRRLRDRLRRAPPRMDTETMVTRSGATVDTFAHVRELPADALALMSRAEQRHIEFGADWHANLIDTVYRCEPETHTVRIYVLRRFGRALAVLPTVAQSGALGPEVSALSNFYTAIYAPALADGLEADDLMPLMRELRRGGRGAAAYRFSPMDPASREFPLVRRALGMAGLSTHSYFTFGNWYEPVHQSWTEYLQDRSGQVRSTIKRNGKKFAAEGGRLEIVSGGERLDIALAAYLAVYQQSWKLAEPYPDFVPGLIRLCARRGWLRLGLAWLGDKPVAAQIWIVANGRADIYKLAYDEAYKALAPGTLLTALLMEQAIDVDRVQEIDYLIGDDPYKATWMSKRRERFGLIAYDPATLSGLIGMARQAVGETWRRMRRKPWPRPDNPAA